jgi:hypothetical protein
VRSDVGSAGRSRKIAGPGVGQGEPRRGVEPAVRLRAAEGHRGGLRIGARVGPTEQRALGVCHGASGAAEVDPVSFAGMPLCEQGQSPALSESAASRRTRSDASRCGVEFRAVEQRRAVAVEQAC